LFSYVSPELLARPTFSRLLALLDNYEPRTGRDETETAEEQREQQEFLDAALDTPVLALLERFVLSKGGAALSLWCPHGVFSVPMVSLWCPHGVPSVPMVSLWYPHGVSTMSPWCPPGVPTVSPRCPYGVPPGCTSCPHDVPMVSPGLYPSAEAFRADLHSMWFGLYSRSSGKALDSSGFEHVFHGEGT
ncbi:poly(U)-specific endoribonuclease-C-like, partial [Cyanistes caeruleus]|uniref:poly(U)-specific endoribonuclease-C-like n=1 Tax=Cyanistes caeruleus TaxID=156563 RepID=UPI000CDA701D